MKNENLTKSQSQQKGTKAEGSVGHGINNTAQWLPSDDSAPSMGKKGKQLIDYSTFPVRVKMVLRELAEFVYEPELITIADYFRHFDFEVQHKMAQFFFDEYFRYDTN